MIESTYITQAREKYWARVSFLTYATLGESEFDSRYRWNPELGGTGRYIDRNGRIVKGEVITDQLEKVIEGVQSEMTGLALDLVDGKISVQEWYDKFRLNVKTMHGVAGSLAKGGWAQMRDDDWELIKTITLENLDFLNNLAQGLDDGSIKRDGNFLRRVNQYVAAARSTKEEIKRKTMMTTATHEKRVLGPADHCRSQEGMEGCWELWKKGWEPIGTMPKIGETPCRQNCRCHFVYAIWVPGVGYKIIG